MDTFISRLGASVSASTPTDVTVPNGCRPLDRILSAAYIDVSAANTAITALTVEDKPGNVDADNEVAVKDESTITIQSGTALVADDIITFAYRAIGEVTRP